MMREMRCAIIVLALTMVASLAFAQTTSPAPSRTGDFEITFRQRSPLSGIDVQHARYGVERAKPNLYELEAERFRIEVSEDFAADTDGRWGVIVWCDAGKGGRLPREVQPLLAKKKLIAIAAFDAGNQRGVGVRVGLTLDAVHNLRQQYPTLDLHRTYVAGTSGGAKVAEMAAMAFPEVFDGAICCVGANWYKDTPVPGKPNTAWPQAFRKPPMKTFVDARDHVGFILITGPADGNYLPMKTMFERGFQADEFKHASFYDVPDLGHQTAPTEWLEKAIDELDALPKKREKKLPTTTPARRATSRPGLSPSPGTPGEGWGEGSRG